MRPLSIAFFLLVSIGISAVGQEAASSPSTSLAYVLDPDEQTVAAVDLVSGKKTATVFVSDSGDFGRDALLLTPDGSRLVMLIAGTQKKNNFDEHEPASKSTATIIDTKTMKPVEPIDLGWGLINYYLAPDSKVLVSIASGFKSEKSRNNFPGEIVATNLSSGQVIERIAIQRPPKACLLSKDGAIAVLFYAKQWIILDPKQGLMLDAKQTRMHEAYSPAELQFISIEKQAVIGKVTLDGEPDMPVMSPTGEFIYLLEKGYPSHNPGQNINGRIHIVSLNDMKIAAVLDAGSDPKIALLDDAAGQTLILSKGPPVKAHGEIVDAELRVIRGASIASLLKVGNGPRHLSFSPDRRRLYVTSSVDLSTYNGLSAGDPTFNTTVYPGAPGPSGYPSLDLLTAIDYTSLKVLGQMHLDGAVSEVAFTPDGTLGFALDPKSSQMLVLDLQALKTGALVTTGRFNIKADEFILSTFEAAASIWFTPAIVVFTASNHYAFPSANTLMSVRPDGAFVYVLNHSTSDVTVVNTRTSSIIDMIAAGGRRLQPLNGGGVLAVVGRDSLHRIDTSSQKALSDVHFGSKLLDLSFSPDGRTALALVEGSVVLLNGSTGEVRSRIEGFNRPRTIVFAQPGGAPGASTQP